LVTTTNWVDGLPPVDVLATRGEPGPDLIKMGIELVVVATESFPASVTRMLF
jgi:hypothetical protein